MDEWMEWRRKQASLFVDAEYRSGKKLGERQIIYVMLCLKR